MAILRLNISTARPATWLNFTFETAGGGREISQRISNFIQGVFSGSEGAYSLTVPPSIGIEIQDNKTAASGTITWSGSSATNDTILINGVTFTCVASGATGNQYNQGTAAVTAASFSANLNASTTALITGVVTSTVVAGVVTISAINPGIMGNLVTTAKGVDAGTVVTVSGARLTGGLDDATAQTLTF